MQRRAVAEAVAVTTPVAGATTVARAVTTPEVAGAQQWQRRAVAEAVAVTTPEVAGARHRAVGTGTTVAWALTASEVAGAQQRLCRAGTVPAATAQCICRGQAGTAQRMAGTGNRTFGAAGRRRTGSDRCWNPWPPSWRGSRIQTDWRSRSGTGSRSVWNGGTGPRDGRRARRPRSRGRSGERRSSGPGNRPTRREEAVAGGALSRLRHRGGREAKGRRAEPRGLLAQSRRRVVPSRRTGRLARVERRLGAVQVAARERARARRSQRGGPSCPIGSRQQTDRRRWMSRVTERSDGHGCCTGSGRRWSNTPRCNKRWRRGAGPRARWRSSRRPRPRRCGVWLRLMA